MKTCIYCLEEYGTSRINEGWVQCKDCKDGAYEGCTGYDAEDLDDFYCTKCLIDR